MPFAPAAAAAVGVVGSVAASEIQSGAVKDATSSANAAQTAAEERARASLSPFSDAGQGAVEALRGLSGANGPDAMRAAQGAFVESPGYQWQLGEGLRAVDAGAASKGLLHSGATIKGEEAYAEGLAKQDFSTYYNNLFNLSTLGENAAAKTGSNAITTGQGLAQTDASGAAALTSIFGNEGKGLTTATNSLFSNPKVQSSINGLFTSPGTTGASGGAFGVNGQTDPFAGMTA